MCAGNPSDPNGPLGTYCSFDPPCQHAGQPALLHVNMMPINLDFLLRILRMSGLKWRMHPEQWYMLGRSFETFPQLAQVILKGDDPEVDLQRLQEMRRTLMSFPVEVTDKVNPQIIELLHNDNVIARIECLAVSPGFPYWNFKGAEYENIQKS